MKGDSFMNFNYEYMKEEKEEKKRGKKPSQWVHYGIGTLCPRLIFIVGLNLMKC